MESLNIAFIVLMLLVFYLGLGVWVFSGLLLVSVSGLALLLDMPFHRIGTIMAPLILSQRPLGNYPPFRCLCGWVN